MFITYTEVLKELDYITNWFNAYLCVAPVSERRCFDVVTTLLMSLQRQKVVCLLGGRNLKCRNMKSSILLADKEELVKVVALISRTAKTSKLSM